MKGVYLPQETPSYKRNAKCRHIVHLQAGEPKLESSKWSHLEDVNTGRKDGDKC